MMQEIEILKGILSKFKRIKVMLIGDLYLDEYLYGTAVNISREGHAIESEIEKHEFALGGAANTANNLKALGADVTVVGVVGDDFCKDILFAKFKESRVKTDNIVVDKDRKTNHYMKFRGRAPHTEFALKELLRTPPDVMISQKVESAVLANIKRSIKKVDAIIMTEQLGGAITESLIAQVAALAKKNKVITVGDARTKISQFKDFTFIKPNDFEAASAINPSINMVEEIKKEKILEIGKMLVQNLSLEGALVTRGKDGMVMFGKNAIFSLPTFAKDVVDVTGAGDTVTAAFTLATAAGASVERAAIISNAAAAVAVKKAGTAKASVDEIIEVLNNVKNTQR